MIIRGEVVCEIPYFWAHDEATHEALAIACSGSNTSGHAEIKCNPPNYPPAQLRLCDGKCAQGADRRQRRDRG
jgi:hypothetical protein